MPIYRDADGRGAHENLVETDLRLDSGYCPLQAGAVGAGIPGSGGEAMKSRPSRRQRFRHWLANLVEDLEFDLQQSQRWQRRQPSDGK